MKKFAKSSMEWLNKSVKNNSQNITNKIISRYYDNRKPPEQAKSTNINILLNRIQTNQKTESRKKLYFSAAASTGLLLFGLIIF
tara:strand:+ start:257 stop:508 length:252 start_codon:yes stop_codon:yes gene_type:complete